MPTTYLTWRSWLSNETTWIGSTFWLTITLGNNFLYVFVLSCTNWTSISVAIWSTSVLLAIQLSTGTLHKRSIQSYLKASVLFFWGFANIQRLKLHYPEAGATIRKHFVLNSQQILSYGSIWFFLNICPIPYPNGLTPVPVHLTERTYPIQFGPDAHVCSDREWCQTRCHSTTTSDWSANNPLHGWWVYNVIGDHTV